MGAMKTLSYSENAMTETTKRDEREAFEEQVAQAAWDTYLDEQKRIPYMPGLLARPSFLAGYRAALATAPEQVGEAIYQERTANGMWQDISKELHDSIVAGRVRSEGMRIVYTAPPLASKDWCMKMARLEPDNVDLTVGVEPCDLPPSGWFCTRGKGHQGPCAAPPPASTNRLKDAQIVALADKHFDWGDVCYVNASKYTILKFARAIIAATEGK